MSYREDFFYPAIDYLEQIAPIFEGGYFCAQGKQDRFFFLPFYYLLIGYDIGNRHSQLRANAFQQIAFGLNLQVFEKMKTGHTNCFSANPECHGQKLLYTLSPAKGGQRKRVIIWLHFIDLEQNGVG